MADLTFPTQRIQTTDMEATILRRTALNIQDIAGGKSVTPAIANVSSSGTVAAGARSLTFIFSPDFAGTILGVAFAGGVDDDFTISTSGRDYLTAVAYTVTAGSLKILSLT